MAAHNGKKTRGEPSKYSPELVDEIIKRVSEGEPLRVICRENGKPNYSTFYDWINELPELAQRFAKSRAEGYDAIAQQTLDIADAIPERERDSGKIDSGYVAHSKLRIETRLKLLAKWDPKRYGEKLALGGADDLPAVKTENTVTLEPAEAYKRLIGG